MKRGATPAVLLRRAEAKIAVLEVQLANARFVDAARRTPSATTQPYDGDYFGDRR